MSKLTVEKKGKFLSNLTEGWSVTNAADGIGVSRQALYKLRQEDENFADEWDSAIEEGTDRLEDEAIRRAMGNSDTLMIFMLKARRPQKYKDRVENQLTGKDGGVLIVPGISKNPSEWEQQAIEQQVALKGQKNDGGDSK